MGQARNRGTRDQRVAEAIDRNTAAAKLQRDVRVRRASPKHAAFMAAVVGMIASTPGLAEVMRATARFR